MWPAKDFSAWPLSFSFNSKLTCQITEWSCWKTLCRWHVNCKGFSSMTIFFDLQKLFNNGGFTTVAIWEWELRWYHYFLDWHHEKLISYQFKPLSNLTFSQKFWLFLSFWFIGLSAVSPAEKKSYFGFDRWVFHDVNLKKNGAIVIPQFSTICGTVCKSFGDIRETFTLVRFAN